MYGGTNTDGCDIRPIAISRRWLYHSVNHTRVSQRRPSELVSDKEVGEYSPPQARKFWGYPHAFRRFVRCFEALLPKFRRMFRLQNRCPGCMFQKNLHVPVSMFQGVWDTPPPPPSYRGTGDIGGVRLLTMMTPYVLSHLNLLPLVSEGRVATHWS